MVWAVVETSVNAVSELKVAAAKTEGGSSGEYPASLSCPDGYVWLDDTRRVSR